MGVPHRTLPELKTYSATILSALKEWLRDQIENNLINYPKSSNLILDIFC